jgi:hypothetical protein
METKRNCFNCHNGNVCYIRRSIWKLTEAWNFNIDTKTDAQKSVMDIFTTTAEACLEYSPKTNTVTNKV